MGDVTLGIILAVYREYEVSARRGKTFRPVCRSWKVAPSAFVLENLRVKGMWEQP